MITDNLRNKDTQRFQNDTFLINEKAENSFSGIIDKTFRFIEDIQLLDSEAWKRFADQFRIASDSSDRGWRGEYWGKMMRGACFVYSYTKNPHLYRILSSTVADLISTADDSGRISTYTPQCEFTGWDIWARKYVILGMIYFTEICSDEAFKKEICACIKAQVDYIMRYIGDGDGKKSITLASNNWRGANSSSLLEAVMRVYFLSGEKKYLDFATHIVSCGGTSIADVFQIAYENNTPPYQFPVTKAYELMSCFEGLLEYYRATKDEKCKRAVINFAEKVAEYEISIIGCAGSVHEYFDHAAARQTDSTYTGIMQETCVTVTWMKFCMNLFLLTGDKKYVDCFETSLYNAYLGAVNTNKVPDKGIRDIYPDALQSTLPFDSYSSLLPGVRGAGIGGLRLMPDKHYYGCCACIGSAGIGMVHKLAVTANENTLAVNLYIPGKIKTVTPSGKNITLNVDTEYPAAGDVKITLEPEDIESFNIALRIPSWSDGVTVTVNGDKYDGGNIRKAWCKGDVISISFNMSIKAVRPTPVSKDIIITDVNWKYDYMIPRVVTMSPDAADRIAFTYGPLVLASDARVSSPCKIIHPIIKSDGTAQGEKIAHPDFPVIISFEVKTADCPVKLIDYASAGKTYDEASKYACWLPCPADT